MKSIFGQSIFQSFIKWLTAGLINLTASPSIWSASSMNSKRIVEWMYTASFVPLVYYLALLTLFPSVFSQLLKWRTAAICVERFTNLFGWWQIWKKICISCDEYTSDRNFICLWILCLRTCARTCLCLLYSYRKTEVAS